MSFSDNPRCLEVIAYTGTQRTVFTHHVYIDSVELTASREPNTAKVTVHNLGPGNRGILSADHQALEIWAGYKKPSKIFAGQTYSVRHIPPTSSQPGWETKIEAGDGIKQYNTIWVSNVWPSGTPVNAIVTELAATMALPSDSRMSDRLTAPWSYNGPAFEALSELCWDFGARWDIFQGVLEFMPADDTNLRNESLAILISNSTGMIGSAEVTEQKKRGKNKKFGVSCTTLLNPNIRPNGLVKIESAIGGSLARTKKGTQYRVPGGSGVFRVKRVTHYGSLFTNDFYTDLETESFSAQ